MDFTELVAALGRRWKTIVALTLLTTALGVTFSVTSPRVYESSTNVYVTSDSSNAQEAAASSLYATQRVASYADMANHRVLMKRVIDALDLEMTSTELSERVRAEVKPETVIIKLTVSDADPRQAQVIADEEARQFVEFLEELERPSTSDVSQVIPTVTNPATYNPTPVTPRTALNVVVATLIGLLLGIAIALVRDLFDQSIKTAVDVEAATGVPLMAGVSFDPSVAKTPLISDQTAFSPRAESFRLLRTNLQFLDLDNPPRSIVITSSISGEGKTSSATNLAVALAQAGRRVLLIDGDLRRPRIAELLKLEGSIGLTTVLVGRTKLEDSIQKHEESGVYVLTSGPTPPNPSEILQSKATHALLATLRENYDMVIIDAPPLLPVADAAILATATDGAIIIARHGATSKDQLHGAALRLQKVGARTFGVVLNMVPKRMGDMNYYYYYYAEATPKAVGKRKHNPPPPQGAKKK